MERLTRRSDTGHAYFPRCFEEPCGGDGCKIKDCLLDDIICDRLSAYEDTGLEPAEVHSMHGEWSAMMSVLNSIGGGYDRLRELAEAEKDGRLVVLPCRVGEKLWVTGRDNVPREMKLEPPDIRTVCTDEDNLCMSTCNRRPDGYCAYRLRNDGTSIGKTVFLTREEAEKALEAMK